jgi:hypothetical protein
MVESEEKREIGLEHHYRDIESYMLRFSQNEQLTRIDHMNYRTAIREVNLYFAEQSFRRGDMNDYRRYNSIAEDSNRQLRALQVVSPTHHRPSRRHTEGLVNFREVKRLIEFRMRKSVSIF